MTTIIFGEEMDCDIEYLKNKLPEVTNPIEYKRLERAIDILQDAVVIYKLTREDSERNNGIRSSSLHKM